MIALSKLQRDYIDASTVLQRYYWLGDISHYSKIRALRQFVDLVEPFAHGRPLPFDQADKYFHARAALCKFNWND